VFAPATVRLSAIPHARRLRFGFAALLLALTALTLTAAPAFAEGSHVLSSSFGAATSTPANPYPLSGPTDVETDRASHDFYVTDPGNHRVEKFDSTGKFLLMFGKSVNQTTGGNVCPTNPGDVCKAGVSGSTPGAFETPEFIAVDNSSGPSKGDVYVADPANALVQKFDSSGHIVSSWGESGQKNGSDSIDLFGNFGKIDGLAIDSEGNGKLYVLSDNGPIDALPYTESGEYIEWIPVVGERGFKFYKNGLYGSNSSGALFAREPLREGATGKLNYQLTEEGGTTTGFAFDPSAGDLYRDTGNAIEHFGPQCAQLAGPCDPAECAPLLKPCTPLDSFGGADLSAAAGVVVGESGTVYVADTGHNDIAVFTDVRPKATTGPPLEVEETSATLTGEAELNAHGPIAECRFEYGFDSSYGNSVPCSPDPASSPPGSHFTGPTSVTAALSGLTPLPDLPIGSKYHYRLVLTNEQGASALGRDRTFTTTAAPQIEGFSTSHVTASSAELDAAINTNGLDTTYRFEYGTTSAYGSVAPVPDGTVGSSQTIQHVAVPIGGLEGVTYHFRLIVENALGSATSEDQTFEFFPPNCPNSAVRQQTGSAYLPDCRAYELVSPGNANGTLLYAGGPNTGEATAPSRLSFTGNANSLKGTNTIETAADLYTATRTDSGWESKYIGLPGDEAGCMGGPPNSPTSHVVFLSPPYLTNTVLTDPSMSKLLVWPDGTPMNCFPGRSPFYDNNWELASPSNSPYMFNADGSINQRLPTGFSGGEEAVEALKCPYPNENYVTPPCTGDVTASADLSHFVFSSNKASFAEGGVEGAPGSAYDNDLATHTVSLISLDSSGHPIAQDPNFANVPPECAVVCQTDANGEIASVIEAHGGKEEFIRFPAISNDGSHILMSTATTPTRDCNRGQSAPEPCARFTDTPIHLYMRVNDAITYEPSRGEDGVNHAVKFLGMTPDGSNVFFTSEEQLIAEDKDESADLYMWSESSESLTLVSKGDNSGNAGEAGQADNCSASWAAKCGVQPNANYEWSLLPGGEGGNGIADSAITPGGDIYFYSPEQLDGNKGLVGGQNLYDYREGKAQFVATFKPEQKCRPADLNSAILCAEGPIVRFEATPNDSRAAFLTATQLTSYDNAGHIEMYVFTPSSGEIVCASCRPDGQAPTDDVKASQDGRFITNDGRVFFSTADSLVPQDTNEGIDVYEFVDGRSQLITPGTGTATAAGGSLNISGFAEKPGLVGVSNDGTDVYFDTFDVLTAEDHNGNFLKFYDARVNGGFAQPTPVPPCRAAEECHGAGSSAPALPTQGTAAGISGGNAKQKTAAKKKHKQKKHKKAAKRHRARAAKSKGRAGK